MANTVNAAATSFQAQSVPQPAPLQRAFGWGILGALVAFLVNNVMVVGYGGATLGAIATGGIGAAWQPILIYLVCIGAGVAFALSRPDVKLREDAALIHGFNVYLIRSLFWSVFIIGVVDATIAVMRVENFLPLVVSEDLAREFTRSAFVAPYFHFPLIALGFIIGAFTRTLGFTWLTLLVVGSELLIVFTRFVFSYEQALMGDLVRYWYAALFLFAAAYTLYEEGHVRVDIYYATRDSRGKGALNAYGTMLLGMVTVWTFMVIAMNGKTSIVNSPVINLEITQTGSNGMFIKYQMAAFLAIFCVTMIIQFVSYWFESIADWRGEPGKREIVSAAQ